MAIQVTAPERIAFSLNPIVWKFEADGEGISGGSTSQNLIVFTGAVPVGSLLPVRWNGNQQQLRAVASPADYGGEFPAGDGGTTYVASLVSWFQNNYYFNEDFVVAPTTYQTFPALQFQSRQAGKAYDFSPANFAGGYTLTDVSGVDSASPVNASVMVEVWVKKGLALGYARVYRSPLALDGLNAATLDVSSILHAELRPDMPSMLLPTGGFVHDSRLDYYIRYAPAGGENFSVGQLTQSDVYTALLGGTSYEAGSDATVENRLLGLSQDQDKFLSLLGPTRYVFRDQPAFLSFINLREETRAEATLLVTVHYSDETSAEIELAGVVTLHPYLKAHWGVGYNQLALAHPTKIVSHYTARLIDETDAPISEEVLFIVRYEHRPYLRYFAYTNSLGAPETLCTYGKGSPEVQFFREQAEQVLPYAYAREDGQYLEWDHRIQEGFDAASGWIAEREYLAFRDMFRSVKKFRIVGGETYPINIQTNSIKEGKDGSNTHAVGFSYQYAYQNKAVSEGDLEKEHSVNALTPPPGLLAAGSVLLPGLGVPNTGIVDAFPTISSPNLVTSGGVYEALSYKQDKLTLGSTAQYLRGDGSLANFTTAVRAAELDPTVPTYAKALVSKEKVLSDLTTIDGLNSGLDADLWRGQTPAQMSVWKSLQWAAAITLSLSGAVTGSAAIDGSGNVSLVTTITGEGLNAAGAHIQGGNAFGAISRIGTTDNYDVELLASNQVFLSLSPAANFIRANKHLSADAGMTSFGGLYSKSLTNEDDVYYDANKLRALNRAGDDLNYTFEVGNDPATHPNGNGRFIFRNWNNGIAYESLRIEGLGIVKIARQAQFNQVQGTSPFTVASSTEVANLNANLLQGYTAAQLLGAQLSGTANRLPKFNTAGNGLVNSAIYENGGNVGINNLAPLHAIDATGNVRASGQFISTVANGTAPWVVASNTLVANLNADKLDGWDGAYYQDAANLNAGVFAIQRHPLSGVAAGSYFLTIVNSYGHVTSGSNPTTLAGFGIVDAVSSNGSYVNPSWLVSIPASKVTGLTAPIVNNTTINYLPRLASANTFENSALYQDPATGFLGIGRTMPTVGLDINGDLRIFNFAASNSEYGAGYRLSRLLLGDSQDTSVKSSIFLDSPYDYQRLEIGVAKESHTGTHAAILTTGGGASGPYNTNGSLLLIGRASDSANGWVRVMTGSDRKQTAIFTGEGDMYVYRYLASSITTASPVVTGLRLMGANAFGEMMGSYLASDLARTNAPASITAAWTFTTVAPSSTVPNVTANDFELATVGWVKGYTTSGSGTGTYTDPTPSWVNAITQANITNWNTAHSWGNHNAMGYHTQAAFNAAIAGYQPLHPRLTNIAGLGQGFWARGIGSDNLVARTLLQGAGISIVNGSGQIGDPIISLADVHAGFTVDGITVTSRGQVAGISARTYENNFLPYLPPGVQHDSRSPEFSPIAPLSGTAGTYMNVTIDLAPYKTSYHNSANMEIKAIIKDPKGLVAALLGGLQASITGTPATSGPIELVLVVKDNLGNESTVVVPGTITAPGDTGSQPVTISAKLFDMATGQFVTIVNGGTYDWHPRFNIRFDSVGPHDQISQSLTGAGGGTFAWPASNALPNGQPGQAPSSQHWVFGPNGDGSVGGWTPGAYSFSPKALLGGVVKAQPVFNFTLVEASNGTESGAVLSQGYPSLMHLSIQGSAGAWRITDNATAAPPSGKAWWYIVGSKRIRTGTGRLQNEPWNGNHPGHVTKMALNSDITNLDTTPLGVTVQDFQQVGSLFDKDDVGAITTFFFQ